MSLLFHFFSQQAVTTNLSVAACAFRHRQIAKFLRKEQKTHFVLGDDDEGDFY